MHRVRQLNQFSLLEIHRVLGGCFCERVVRRQQPGKGGGKGASKQEGARKGRGRGVVAERKDHGLVGIRRPASEESDRPRQLSLPRASNGDAPQVDGGEEVGWQLRGGDIGRRGAAPEAGESRPEIPRRPGVLAEAALEPHRREAQPEDEVGRGQPHGEHKGARRGKRRVARAGRRGDTEDLVPSLFGFGEAADGDAAGGALETKGRPSGQRAEVEAKLALQLARDLLPDFGCVGAQLERERGDDAKRGAGYTPQRVALLGRVKDDSSTRGSSSDNLSQQAGRDDSEALQRLRERDLGLVGAKDSWGGPNVSVEPHQHHPAPRGVHIRIRCVESGAVSLAAEAQAPESRARGRDDVRAHGCRRLDLRMLEKVHPSARSEQRNGPAPGGDVGRAARFRRQKLILIPVLVTIVRSIRTVDVAHNVCAGDILVLSGRGKDGVLAALLLERKVVR